MKEVVGDGEEMKECGPAGAGLGISPPKELKALWGTEVLYGVFLNHLRHLRVGYAPTTGFLQRLLAEAGVAHLQGLLPHAAKDGRLCRIEAFPKSVLYLDHQVADTPVAGCIKRRKVDSEIRRKVNS